MPEEKKFLFFLYNKPTLVIVDWANVYNKHKNIDLGLFFNYLTEYKEIYQIRFYSGLIEGKDWSQKTLDDANNIGYKVITKKSKYIKIDINKEKHLENILNLLDELLEDVSGKNSDISNRLYSIQLEIRQKLSINDTDINVSDLIGEIGDIELDLEKLNKKVDEFKIEIKKTIRKPKCDFDAEIARDVILEIDKYENLILFSGDGDFASTVKYLIEQEGKRIFVVYSQGSFGEPDYIDNDLINISDDSTKYKYTYKKNFRPIQIDHIVRNFIKKEPADFSAGPDMINVANPDLEVK